MHGARSVEAAETSYERSHGPAPGIVFVPCALCLGPVDLSVAREMGDRPLCESHRSADDLRLS